MCSSIFFLSDLVIHGCNFLILVKIILAFKWPSIQHHWGGWGFHYRGPWETCFAYEPMSEISKQHRLSNYSSVEFTEWNGGFLSRVHESIARRLICAESAFTLHLPGWQVQWQFIKQYPFPLHCCVIRVWCMWLLCVLLVPTLPWVPQLNIWVILRWPSCGPKKTTFWNSVTRIFALSAHEEEVSLAIYDVRFQVMSYNIHAPSCDACPLP